MLKKYLVLLVVGLTLNLTFGQSEPALITLTPSSQTVYDNNLVSVQVGVEGVVGLFAISVTIAFDNSIIKCQSITNGTFLESNPQGYDVFFETFPQNLSLSDSILVDQSILGISSVTGSGNIFEITFQPMLSGTSQISVISMSLRDLNNQEIIATAETAEISVVSSVVNAKVFLQGPYNSGTMTATLNSSGFIPITQPYNISPWNYIGSESVAANFFTTQPNIIDWVLVELRTGTSASSTIATRAAFLKNDGVIVDLDGLSPVLFSVINSIEYYVVIKHRNHLSVMSSITIGLSGTTALYDFTTSQTKAFGTNAMIDLGGEVFGMIAADANGNGQVQNTDQEFYWALQNGQSGYKEADYNLNGQVQNTDNEFYWVPNNGKGTQVPD